MYCIGMECVDAGKSEYHGNSVNSFRFIKIMNYYERI